MAKVKIGFSKSKKLMSKVIRWFTKSQASHTFLIIEGGFFGTDVVLQSTAFKGFQLVSYRDFQSSHNIVKVMSVSAPLDIGIRKCSPLLGQDYDYLGVVGTLVVLAGRWVKKKWRNPLNDSNAMFCSELVVKILQASGYPGSEALVPEATTPQDLMDFLESQAV
jgi:hypothetical protein